MFRTIGLLAMLCGLFLGVAQTADAHERLYRDHVAPRHQHVGADRAYRMPRRLVDDRDFHRWYRRTPLQHNHYLAWWQLYEIYLWERRFGDRRHVAVYYGPQYHDYDWYQHYWRKRDHDRHHRHHH